MQLIIDIGNTLIKYYVFDEGVILDSYHDPLENWSLSLQKIKKEFPKLKSAIISDVNGSFINELQEALVPLPFVNCSIELKLPFKTQYNPPKQLGQDRIALLAACQLLYHHKNVLVIDIGSCITYDLLDQNGIHQGGAISPGFSMRFKSMSDYSGKLPLLQPKKEGNDLVGTSTEAAMHSGVYHGIFFELQGIISIYQSKHKHLTVILTGGDAQMLSKPLKNSIFAHSNFLAKGLNHILAMNQIS